MQLQSISQASGCESRENLDEQTENQEIFKRPGEQADPKSGPNGGTPPEGPVPATRARALLATGPPETRPHPLRPVVPAQPSLRLQVDRATSPAPSKCLAVDDSRPGRSSRCSLGPALGVDTLQAWKCPAPGGELASRLQDFTPLPNPPLSVA